MKNTKQVLALAMAVAMAAGLLAGCGSSASSSAESVASGEAVLPLPAALSLLLPAKLLLPIPAAAMAPWFWQIPALRASSARSSPLLPLTSTLST